MAAGRQRTGDEEGLEPQSGIIKKWGKVVKTKIKRSSSAQEEGRYFSRSWSASSRLLPPSPSLTSLPNDTLNIFDCIFTGFEGEGRWTGPSYKLVDKERKKARRVSGGKGWDLQSTCV